MKNILWILIVLPFFLNAQSPELRASLIVGPNISWLSSDNNQITTEENRIGFKFHLQGEMVFNKKYSFCFGTGLSLVQGGKLGYKQGGNLWSETKLNVPKPDSLPNGVGLSYRIKYLDFPVSFKLTTVQHGKYRFYAQLPEINMSIRMGARGNIIGNAVSDLNENIRHEIFFINFGWGLGIGTEYELKDGMNLIFGIRYMESLIDVTDNSGKFFDGSKNDSKDIVKSVDFRVGLIF